MKKAFDAYELLRDELKNIEPYDPKFTQTRINLFANENAYGLPDTLNDTFAAALKELSVERYPLPLADALREKIAEDFNVSKQNVIVGNGGDEIIFNLLLAYGGPQSLLVTAPPDFSVYGLYAKLTSTPHTCVERERDTLTPNYEELFYAAKDAKLIFLTSPNNPTGDLFDKKELERLLASTDALVLLDEAYIDFAGADASARSLLSRYPNLAILRTFSKAFALAGARVGYLLADSSVIDGIARVRQPYSVNVLSQRLAYEAYTNKSLFANSLRSLIRSRDELYRELSDFEGVHVWPSSANFVLVRIERAHDMWQELRDTYSILVRDFSNVPLLEDCLRMSVGTDEECSALVSAISEILSKRKG